jgi:amino acid transporter
MLGHFGFSYVGLFYLLALAIPNAILAWRLPDWYNSSGESRVLWVLERVGQVMCVVSLLIFSDTNAKGFQLWTIWLWVFNVMIVLYVCYWIRYFRSRRIA